MLPQALGQATNNTPSSVQATPQVPPQQGNQPNFLERLLPTAGGILGGLGGAIFGGGVGGVGGAAGGDALGKFLEDKLTGQAGGNGVLGAAVSGGVGQLAGEGIGSLLGKGAGALGGLADKEAGNLVQGQFAKGTMDSGTTQALRDMGITDAKQVGQIAPLATGADGAIKTGVQRGLAEAGQPADLSNVANTARNLIADNQMQLSSANAPHDISQTVEKGLLQAVKPGSVTQVAATKAGAPSVNVFAPGALKNVDPESAFNVTQNFEKLASKAYQGAYDKMGNVDPDQLAKYNIFRGLADETEKNAFGGDTPLPLSEGNKAQIIQDLAPMKDINPQAYNWHVNQVSNANNVQDLRAIQSPMVKASRALGVTQRVAESGAGKTAANVANNAMPVLGGLVAGPGGAAAALGSRLLSSDAAGKVGASTLERVANILQNPTMSKILNGGAVGTGQVVANSPNDIATAQQGAPGMMPTAYNSAMPGATMPGANPYATAGITPTSMSPEVMAMQSGLIGLQDPYLAGSYAPLVNNAVGGLQKAGAANAALQGLEGSYQQAGGGQGLLGGLANRIGQTLTGGQGTLLGGGYSSQAEELQKALAAAGINVPAPSLLENSGAAQQNFSLLQQIVNALGGGGSPMAGMVPVNS